MTIEELALIVLVVVNCLFIAVSLVIAGNLIAHVAFG